MVKRRISSERTISFRRTSALLLMVGVLSYSALNASAQKSDDASSTNTSSTTTKKAEFNFLRYATTNDDIDLLLNTAISLEHEKRFDEALKFADAARKTAPLSKSVVFLTARIKSKKLSSSGKKSESKRMVDAIINDPWLTFPFEKNQKQNGVRQEVTWDLSNVYAQPAGAFDKMLKTFMKSHPRKLDSSVAMILWQSAGAPASYYCDEAQFYELSAKPPALPIAYVLGKEAYILGAKKSSAVRTIFGRIALKYATQLKDQGKTKDASAVAREFLSTGCGYNRTELKKF